MGNPKDKKLLDRIAELESGPDVKELQQLHTLRISKMEETERRVQNILRDLEESIGGFVTGLAIAHDDENDDKLCIQLRYGLNKGKNDIIL